MDARPDELKRDIERTRAEIAQDVDRIGEHTSPRQIMRRRTEGIRTTTRTIKERVMGTTGHAAGTMKDTIANTPHQAMRGTRGNPLAAGLVAFGVGALAAALIPESRAEKRAAAQVGEYVQPVVDQVKDSAQTLGQEARETAQQAAEKVRQTAGEAAHTTAEQARDHL
ncbi:DUF3618 domain-containing protein [Herbidospora daliensis]|uniref:DUF3618 domain-containing protein n=1 Tax=Herbidospora daliensis TaxID=295585 RepID=UPI0007818DC2|nr:DUF3618 domain-containing protein [Herbidospora daliensis]